MLNPSYNFTQKWIIRWNVIITHETVGGFDLICSNIIWVSPLIDYIFILIKFVDIEQFIKCEEQSVSCGVDH